MKRLVLLVILTLLPAGQSIAHPGRLDKDGCHHVRKDFTYKSGKVVRKGDYHCHRLLIGQPAILDGLEVLADKDDDQKEEDMTPEDQSP